jgi:hypothetical protein
VLVVAMMAVVGFSIPAVALALGPVHNGAPASASVASSASAPSVTSAPSSTQAVPVSSHVSAATTPHPGSLALRTITGGPAKGIDPAYAYDTLSGDMVNNVYEGLLAFNGTSGSTFVPNVAVCVPGAFQGPEGNCTRDFGGATSSIPTFTGIFDTSGAPLVAGGAGTPEYFTYVIDPAAHFYDPATGAGWSVYPTDVMFSISRDLAWALHPGEYDTSGWILAQALLPPSAAYPNGSPIMWDGGFHSAGWNDTPGNILGSMLINDTAFCPTVGGNFVGNGCITFVANGSETSWAGFNYFVEDEGSSVVPCSWYTSVGATVPGFTAASESSSCTLPGDLTTTQSPTWSAYLADLNSTAPGPNNATSWDAFETLGASGYKHNNPEPPVNQYAVGSGPYALAPNPAYPSSPSGGYTDLSTGYSLEYNPYYNQPTGCTLNYAHPYYCYPKGDEVVWGSYVPYVNNTYVSGTYTTDAQTLAEYQSGAVDFAGFTPADTFMLTGGISSGLFKMLQFPTISNFFIDYNLAWNSASWSPDLGPAPNVPSDFAASLTVRNFLSDSFPYGTAFSSLYKSSGIVYQDAAGGPLPYGMDYPMNVSYPGNPNPVTDTASNPVKSMAPTSWYYWWTNGRTVGNPLYDPELAACTTTSACTIVLIGENGATDLNDAMELWASAIGTETGGAIKASFISVSFTTLLSLPYGPANPQLVSNLGWAPDYELPADYLAPEEYANGLFTEFMDNVGTTLAEPQFNSPSCGYSAATYSDLVYWAHAVLTDACQGVAYSVANAESQAADAMTNPTLAKLYYNLAIHVYNNLSLYCWQGQEEGMVVMAPWINASTVNVNPMVGGGGDQYWFMIGYQATTQVDFHQTTLPAGAVWTVSVPGTPAGVDEITSLGNPSSHQAGQWLNVSMPRGTDQFVPSVWAQASGSPYAYESASTASPLVVTKTTPAPVVLTFAPAVSASFTETGLAITPFNNAQWCLTLTSTLAGKGPAAFSACANSPASAGTPSTISANSLGPGSWKYTITIPTGYTICASTSKCAQPSPTWVKAASGTITVTSAYTGNLVFLPTYEKITFSMTGLGVGLLWYVNITNFTPTPSPIFLSYSNFTPAKGANAMVFYLLMSPATAAGTVYQFTVDTGYSLSGYLPSIASGYFQPSAAKTIAITAIDPHHAHAVLYAPGLARTEDA